MPEQENIKAALAFFDAWNAGDLSKGEHTFQADGYVAEGPGGRADEQRTKPDATSRTSRRLSPARSSRYCSPSRKATMSSCTGRSAAARILVRSTLATAALFRPRVRQRRSVRSSTTSQVKNGKVTRSWAFWDVARAPGPVGFAAADVIGSRPQQSLTTRSRFAQCLRRYASAIRWSSSKRALCNGGHANTRSFKCQSICFKSTMSARV